VGKGEAKATPSPLPQGGQFPLFTAMPLSGTGGSAEIAPRKEKGSRTLLYYAGVV